MSVTESPLPVTADVLAECSREPIHIPGSIQPHGFLLTVDETHLQVAQISANSMTWLGSPPEDLLGKFLDDVLPGTVQHLRLLVQREGGQTSAIVPHVVTKTGLHVSLAVHRQQGVLLISGERHVSADGDLLRTFSVIADHVGMVANAATVLEASQATAAAIHTISPFDRILIYRFDPDGNGEVIAEWAAAELESFLGLWYPASDIPVQARASFLIAPIRIIVDTGHVPAPLLPRLNPLDHQPLDLLHSPVRAVSPIHLEYLRNMKVGASLTTAITIQGALWGLITCHHTSPRDIAPVLRAEVYAMTRQLASRIDHLQEHGRLRAQIQADSLVQHVLENFTVDEATDWTSEFLTGGRALSLMEASGALIFYKGTQLTTGAIPGPQVIRRLMDYLRSWLTEDALVVDAIGAHIPGLEDRDLAQCSGFLAIRLAGDVDGVLIWFRPEQQQTVTWGGNPHKPALHGSATRLTPRTSFAAWRSLVKGRCHAWSLQDVAAANALRHHVRGILNRLYEVRNTLARSNAELQDFASFAAHDLQEPLRIVAASCELLDLQMNKLKMSIGPEAIQPFSKILEMAVAAAQRGQALIVDLLDYASLDRQATVPAMVSMTDVCRASETALQQSIADSGAQILLDLLPVVIGHASQLTQLMQNLIGNAIKYRSERPLVVHISAERRAGSWRVTVADNGIGIAPEYHQGIFAMFMRLHGKDQYPGTGVGLAICKKIVTHHGGTIGVASTPGVGSTFYFTIADA